MLNIIILAAGKGSRMLSQSPKVLHHIGGKSLISRVISEAQSLLGDEQGTITVVTGHGADQVDPHIASMGVRIIHQTEQLGTGHAVRCGAQDLPLEGTVVVLYADVPLVTADALQPLVAMGRSGLAVMTSDVDDPTGYGRILRDDQGQLTGIVEERDATIEQRAICEINSGLYAAPASMFASLLPLLANENVQGEYYLTDCVALARQHGYAVQGVKGPVECALGVNDRMQLANLEWRYQQRARHQLMQAGVTLIDPDSVFCAGKVDVGPDTIIGPNVWLDDVEIGPAVHIGMGAHLSRVQIARGAHIKPYSVIESTVIGTDATVGPFARLRPGTQLASDTHVGNFVETKNAVIGEGSKLNHLSYIGDATVGRDVNVGAGTITCNYDGVSKHHTTIGDDVFIGSNTSLVAPIEIGEGATTAAGSVLTENVSPGALAIGRNRQIEKTPYQRPTKGRKS
ncbi:MAG: bifunctional UDP-N-acetylglucosamine diphosphorylase/glucosamine-1-phosphate N-acetyltransferase GlmU [Litorivicinaceae bacterium]|nr:bifunctional UDP-N-acetylglucosamine diphosphorylase/glucosamine-1-phosphate N-acetyltransferase GlmU [Litorivicinaceae bacterium]